MKFLGVFIEMCEDEEQELKKAKKAEASHKKYIEKNKNELDQSLIDLYCENEYFHDAEVLKMVYVGNDTDRKNQLDSFQVELALVESIVQIDFLGVESIKIEDIKEGNENNPYLGRLPESYESILYCELRKLRGKYVFDCIISSGKELTIVYKESKCKVLQ